MQQQQGQWQETPDSFSNKLEGEHFRTYLQNELSYRKNELTLTAALPLSWQHISLNDGDLNHGQQMSRLLFDPRLSADYRISDYNLIYSNQVQPDGTTILQAFEQPNTGYMHTINGQTSKYFSAAKSTISFRASYSNNRRQSLLNNQLHPVHVAGLDRPYSKIFKL